MRERARRRLIMCIRRDILIDLGNFGVLMVGFFFRVYHYYGGEAFLGVGRYTYKLSFPSVMR